MPNYYFPEKENPQFVDVRMLNSDDPVEGAVDGDGEGVDNIALKQLAERTEYNKKKHDELKELVEEPTQILIIGDTEPTNKEAIWLKTPPSAVVPTELKIRKIVTGATPPTDPNALWLKTEANA